MNSSQLEPITRNLSHHWVADTCVTQCHNCQESFGFFFRKHHCRSCGNVFCATCSNWFVTIPEYFAGQPIPGDSWNLSYYATILQDCKKRVCELCYQQILIHERDRKAMIHLIKHPIPIVSLLVSTIHSEQIKKCYLEHLRNIQYYLPSHRYTKEDARLLSCNAVSFGMHSKYLVHLIRSLPWEEESVCCLELVRYLFHLTESNHTCEELLCISTCQEHLSCDDCIHILQGVHGSIHDDILRYLIEVIAASPPEVIAYQMTILVRLLLDTKNSLLVELLTTVISSTKRLRYGSFWLLQILIEQTALITEQQVCNIDQYYSILDPSDLLTMRSEYSFYHGLIEQLDQSVSYLQRNFASYAPISLPYDPSRQLSKVDLSSIQQLESHTRPVLITFEVRSTTKDGATKAIAPPEKITLLFKKESVMTDLVALNLMQLCQIVLRESLDSEFESITYPAMPISAQGGMVEIVPDAVTVYQINKQGHTILQHIILCNQDQMVGSLLRRYMHSLVCYTLHSYFIGLGDRHLQNIMLHRNGSIFHVDFGYIMGQYAHPFSSNGVKVNAEMIDVIGGMDRKMYREYLALCARGITVLHKYFVIFHLMLASSGYASTEQQLDQFLLARFRPGQSDHDLIHEVITSIESSSHSCQFQVEDFLHYHSQERTLPIGLINIVQSVTKMI